jgi:hypothetical protein
MDENDKEEFILEMNKHFNKMKVFLEDISISVESSNDGIRYRALLLAACVINWMNVMLDDLKEVIEFSQQSRNKLN